MIVNQVRRKKRLAVSLAEILIAVALIGVAALPIFGLLTYSSRGTREQEAEAAAGNLAKEEMNRLMYVCPYDDLLEGADNANENKNADRTWSLGGTNNEYKDEKGHIFKCFYHVYKHDKIEFQVPKMIFHDPQKCPTGAEMNRDVVDKEKMTISLDKLYPKNKKTLLVDIYLEMNWKLSEQEKSYDPRNKLRLYGRRCFYVEKNDED